MSGTAKLIIGDNELELPIVVGTEGEQAIDISSLRAQSGYVTLDPGYVNTGSCSSTITFIDGEKGILRYRGIPIEQLATKSTFLETSYLLMNGKLPNKLELQAFQDKITRHTMLHEDIKRIYDGFPKDAHPMAILASVVCSLSTFYQDEEGTPEERTEANSIRLLAKLPTITAFAYKKALGQPFMYPDNSRGYCENFMHMMFANPCERYEVDPEVIKTLEMLLILHADHEQNCSTSTVRMVRSSMTDLYASIASGVLALWGPRHGGANQRVIEMLQQIQGDDGDVQKYVNMAKSKESTFRLFGFGHRVYKNFDPRASILKEQCHRLLNVLQINDPLLDIAQKLEEAALEDDYFKEKRLYPNVDFYSGIIYKALGIPVPAYPVMFALGRLPGWIAQAQEYVSAPKNKIGRPRQIYVGEHERDYVPIAERG